MKPKLLITADAAACIAAWFLPIPGALYAIGVLAMCAGVMWSCYAGAYNLDPWICDDCGRDTREPHGKAHLVCPCFFDEQEALCELNALNRHPKEV